MRIPILDAQHGPLSPAQRDQFNALAASLKPDQAAWLLGYLAATQQLQQAEPSAQSAGASRDGITVIYASQTGNAAKVAKRLVGAAAAAGLQAVAVNAAEYKTSNLRNEANLVLISSTQGEGDPPESAREFHRFLFGKRAPRLERLRFAVLALGDYSYAKFCKAGEDFDRRLEELGGQRILGRVDCDVAYETTAEPWRGQVIEAFKKLLSASGVTVSTPVLPPPIEEPGYDKEKPLSAQVLDRISLNGRGSAKTTAHIELSLAGSAITFEPGDALGVWPRNSPKYIRDLLEVAGLPADAPVTVDGMERPLQEILGEAFEITTITRPFIKAYAAATHCSELEALLPPDQQDSLQRYAFGREIIDVLSTYPPVGLSASAFVGMLRRLQPRFYSIASSLRAHEDEVHLLIGLTRYESHGRVREGVCSSYLCQRLREDEPLRIFPSPNPTFKLPSDPDARIIMIGPGTGVAPFRAFVEEREAAGCRGRNWLFFGDQHFTTDFLYQVEWQRWHKAGVLSHLDLAFSRDQAEKVYVQHRLVEKGRDVYDWLQQGACLYVCGDAEKMAVDVHEALLSIVGQHGGQDRDAAEEYLQKLQTDKRYQRDVY